MLVDSLVAAQLAASQKQIGTMKLHIIITNL
jgi:hypothetical protein